MYIAVQWKKSDGKIICNFRGLQFLLKVKFGFCNPCKCVWFVKRVPQVALHNPAIGLPTSCFWNGQEFYEACTCIVPLFSSCTGHKHMHMYIYTCSLFCRYCPGDQLVSLLQPTCTCTCTLCVSVLCQPDWSLSSSTIVVQTQSESQAMTAKK